jgi:hypothetical protein
MLIPESYLQTIFAVSAEDVITTGATGFFYGFPLVEKKQLLLFFVTSKEALAGHDKPKRLFLGRKASAIDANEIDTSVHKVVVDNDAALVIVNLGERQARDGFLTPSMVTRKQQLQEIDALEGELITAGGFPRYTDASMDACTVRGGVIARIRDCYRGDVQGFLCDLTTTRGQEGSPVFLRPWATGIKSDKQQIYEARLIGICCSPILTPLSDEVGSPEVNTGLTIVAPVDHIESVICTAFDLKIEIKLSPVK